MDEGGNTKDDLGLPKGTADAEGLADQIKKDFDDGKELVVTVLKVSSSVVCLQQCFTCSVVMQCHLRTVMVMCRVVVKVYLGLHSLP